MNHITKSFLFLFVTLTIFQGVNAQEFPKIDASPLDLNIARNEDKSPLIRVIYSRPQKKNRDIFGTLVPFGKVWRTGANEATELELYESLTFGNTVLKPGTYTLYTIPNEKEWTIIINQDTNVWGSYSYNEDKDVARLTVSSKSAAATIESLSMAFKPAKDGVSLMIGWDDRFVEIPFQKVK